MAMVTNEKGILISAGEFKARCRSLLDLVGTSRQVITITKRGKPVARLVSLASEMPRRTFGWLSGLVIAESDIVEPTGAQWEAESGG